MGNRYLKPGLLLALFSLSSCIKPSTSRPAAVPVDIDTSVLKVPTPADMESAGSFMPVLKTRNNQLANRPYIGYRILCSTEAELDNFLRDLDTTRVQIQSFEKREMAPVSIAEI